MKWNISCHINKKEMSQQIATSGLQMWMKSPQTEHNIYNPSDATTPHLDLHTRDGSCPAHQAPCIYKSKLFAMIQMPHILILWKTSCLFSASLVPKEPLWSILTLHIYRPLLCVSFISQAPLPSWHQQNKTPLGEGLSTWRAQKKFSMKESFTQLSTNSLFIPASLHFFLHITTSYTFSRKPATENNIV